MHELKNLESSWGSELRALHMFSGVSLDDITRGSDKGGIEVEERSV